MKDQLGLLVKVKTSLRFLAFPPHAACFRDINWGKEVRPLTGMFFIHNPTSSQQEINFSESYWYSEKKSCSLEKGWHWKKGLVLIFSSLVQMMPFILLNVSFCWISAERGKVEMRCAKSAAKPKSSNIIQFQTFYHSAMLYDSTMNL